MASFKASISYVLANEGGFTADPSDSGGPTNYGITHAVYSRFIGHPASLGEMKSMPLVDAETIYEKEYWHQLQLDWVLDQNVATCILDCGVNMGEGVAIRLAQQASAAPVDGIMGPVTLSHINKATDFIPSFHEAVKDHYEDIVENNPNDAVFLKGWMNRVNKMLTLV